MQDIGQQIHNIRKIAWTLSLASARDQLDVPGEYIWAYPANDSFKEVQDRARSIFSSGNSIKDPEIIEFVQHNDNNKHLLNPWITKQFEEAWPNWIKSGTGYQIKNLDLFTYAGYSQGTQEAFLNFYIMNKDKRLRVFRGDYWWHMDIWSKANFRWEYIENDDGGLKMAALRSQWAQIEPHYEAWKQGHEIAETGTPLGAWPAITQDEAEALRGAGIRTVEDVAALSEERLARPILPRLRDLQRQAKMFLDGLGDAALKAQIVALQEQNAAMLEMLAEQKQEAKRGPGRPRKEETEAA
jgi:hypothetical protein